MNMSIPTKTLPIMFIFFFCFTTCLYQNASRASEPNETTIETGPEDSNTIPATNEYEPNESPAEIKPASQGKTIADYDLALRKHSLEIGPEVYYFKYKEPGGITDKGMFYGGTLNYTFRGWIPDSPEDSLPEGGSAIHADFRFASGEVDYDGSLSDGTPYTIDNIEYTTYETRLLYGMDFLNESWLACLSAGIGYRYSNDDSSFDPHGYERESNYIYLPIAYQLDGKFENNWAWGFQIEVDFLIRGTQKSYLSDVGDVDIENRQNDGYGFRGSIRLQNKTNAGVLIIEPFIRYWNIEDSEYEYVAPYYYWEPKNSTTEVGLQLQWKF